MEQFVRTAIARLRTLSKVEGATFYCDLTGGRDSRIVAGLLSKSAIPPDAIRITTTDNGSKDYEIAGIVAAHLGFQLWRKPDYTDLELRDGQRAFSYWAMASLGCYLPLIPSGPAAKPHQFHLHGGNFIATKFLRRSVAETSELIQRWTRDCGSRDLSADFLSFFVETDVDPDDPLAMQHHYAHMRARFHYGRNWSTPLGITRITPLIDRQLADTFLVNDHATRMYYCDLLLALDDSLATLPFDDPKKNLSLEMVRDSAFCHKPLEVNNITIPELSLYCGEPQHEFNPQGKSMKGFVEDLYWSIEGAAMDTRLFTKAYREVARSEIAAGHRLNRHYRRAAHMLTAGMLAEMVTKNAG